MNLSRIYTTVLTIAGSDGSGGAGIQADLKSIAACGCYGLSVMTAVTAQNTLGVLDIHLIPPEFILRQFEAITADIHIDAVKIGMLGAEESAGMVERIIRSLSGVPVVLDTVLHSTSGKSLFPEAQTESMKRLFPFVSLITPNLPEAARLTGRKKAPSEKKEVEKMGIDLQRAGARSVLIKGGHSEGGLCQDCLVHENRLFWFSHPRIVTGNTHGTGCTLSSAIASSLAMKKGIPDAVSDAIDYTRSAIEAGAAWKLGNGNGPLHHFPSSLSPDRTEKKADHTPEIS